MVYKITKNILCETKNVAIVYKYLLTNPKHYDMLIMLGSVYELTFSIFKEGS